MRKTCVQKVSSVLVLVGALLLLVAPSVNVAFGDIGVELEGIRPNDFEPDEDLRAPVPWRFFGTDSLAGFSHKGMLYRIETEYDTTTGFWVSERSLFEDEFGAPRVFTTEQYRKLRLDRARIDLLQEEFRKRVIQPAQDSGGDALTIQVPFKIRSRTFRRIFGGDRVGLRVSGNINIDGSLRREKSDQLITTQNDQANYNFKIDQTQQFHIVGKVGDKVSVEIDQDSERIFDFENNVRLEYEGYEDEIIQSIEAGNISLSLPGTQLASLTAQNKGLFGFKTVSKVGPLEVTTIASLQKGEKNKLTYTGGSESQTQEGDDRNFVRDQYFFLDPSYRDIYFELTSAYTHYQIPQPVERIAVYKSIQVSTLTPDIYDGWAIFDTTLANQGYVPDVAGLNAQQVAELDSLFDDNDELESANWAEGGFWKQLRENDDYTYNPQTGHIRLNYRVQDEAVAVAYVLEGGQQFGTMDPQGTKVILKLLKPINSTPSDPTWDLSWKHVYWVGTTGLNNEDFIFRLLRNNTERSQTNATGTSWMQVFGLDVFDGNGSANPDGKIDDIFVRYGLGEIHFPDPRPFDPAGYKVGGETIETNIDTALYNPRIYDNLPDTGEPIESNFILESEYSNTSANINLGINVLEGSEEVYLNGAQLVKDQDYIIDYLSGQITILKEEAFDPGANLEINYESGEIFQLDKRTLLGVRLEYALWEDSFVGLTLLHFDEKPLDKRVKVGNEPLRNFVWDMNTRLRFRPYFMTAMVNALPLIDTDTPSEVTIEGEVAQVFPNPNSLNNPSTGDNQGVAYIDDFEAAKRATPLGVQRKNWYAASHPVKLPQGFSPSTIYDNYDIRHRLYWYNPYGRVPIKDIWPNRELNSNVPQETDILVLKLDPEVNNLRREGVDPQITWNGVMRALSPGFYNQTNSKFIEVMLNVEDAQANPEATIYFDMGQISEDVVPNGELNTEDNPLNDAADIGNGILDDGEDTGLDKRMGPDPPWRIGSETSGEKWTVESVDYDYSSNQYDFWDLNGNGVHDPGVIGDPENEPEPFSSDNWSWSGGGGDVDEINGTEGNADDEARYPDTEDLNRNNRVDRANNFYRYQFRPSDPVHIAKYVRGGQDNENGWRLVRIPIEDVFDRVNEPEMTKIESFRIWATGYDFNSSIKIAQIELVGNEWLEDPIVNDVTGDSTIYVTGSTINTYDNPEDYDPPPGVVGEVDPITDVRSKEQSLVLSLRDMPTASEGQLVKHLYKQQDLREYRQLKMFVNGGGRNPQAMAGKDIEMFLRFGSGLQGSNEGYYEYSQRLEPGWEGNNIVIDLDRLTRLKAKAEQLGRDTYYEILPDGDVIKVVKKPSIGSISVYAVGVRNVGRPISQEDGLEVWVDELRVSSIRKEQGMAMRSSMTAKFADLLDFNINMKQTDAEFHGVDERTGSDKSSIEASASGTLNLDKPIDPKLGIKLPLRGTVASSISIPKYTSSNGDIRTESLAEEGDLNIWKRYSEMALSRRHLQDKYQLNDAGEILVDEETGVPVQNIDEWGVDTLFTTQQSYSWSLGYSKSKPSANWLLRYTMDNISLNYNHQQKYSSSLSHQYQKTFTNTYKASYSWSIERARVPVFAWTENIPVLNKLADSHFNWRPTKLNGSLNANETRSSNKYRNALEIPSYSLNLTREWSTGLNLFEPLSMDYSYSAQAQFIREDSLRQNILYEDSPPGQRALSFPPGTAPTVMISTLQDSLRNSQNFAPEGPDIANDADERLNQGIPAEAVLDTLYQEVDATFINPRLPRPWDRVEADDPRYKSTFWTVGNMPFVDKQKSQRITANYNPTLFNWLTTGVNYSTAYTWNWTGFQYLRRGVNSTNSAGANLSLKLRQLLPQPSGGSGGSGRRGRGGRGGTPPDAGGFGQTGSTEEGGEPAGEEGEEEGTPFRFNLSAINPLNLMLTGLHKIQDIRADYTQNLSYNNPGVEDGEADWMYKLGLTGDPGLNKVEGATETASLTRTDDYRFNTGIDWTTRITSALDYSMRLNRSANASNISGSQNRTAFFVFDKDAKTATALDIPNWNLRWTGIEQIGPLESFAQSIALDHAYRGSYTEEWEEVSRPDSLGGRFRQVTQKKFEKAFSPLIGFNINWKYGISTSIKYNSTVGITENTRNESRQRSTQTGITLQASYTTKTGFRIPIPIWPFKNRRFSNETTFSLAYDNSTTLQETMQSGSDFQKTQEQLNWSLTPTINYRFSRAVNGSIRYKYGVTSNEMNTSTYQEFGISVSIQIRG